MIRILGHFKNSAEEQQAQEIIRNHNNLETDHNVLKLDYNDFMTKPLILPDGVRGFHGK
jgi:hypothetical protein